MSKRKKELFRAIQSTGRTTEKIEEIRKKFLERTEEQKDIREILEYISQNTNGFTLPEYTCGTMIAVYLKLQELENKFSLHTSLENDILFKRF